MGCMVETHHYYEKHRLDKNLENINTYRTKDGESKNGGGLKIIAEKHKNVEITKIQSKSTEILEIEIILWKTRITLILLYMDVDKGPKGKKNNRKIMNELHE